jgi:hypothetical protein
VEIGVAQGAGGVVGTTWGTTNILGVARGAIEVVSGARWKSMKHTMRKS